VARDTRVISLDRFRSLLDQIVEVRKMLYGLNRHLDRKHSAPRDVPTH
jgi:hypothetical protein